MSEQDTNPVEPVVNDQIDIETFAKVQLRIGEVVSAEVHPKADRLLVLQIKLGEETRQLVAGMRKWYAPQEMLGKKVVIVANLKPAVLRGVESQGMVLAAATDDDVVLLTVDRDIPSGAKIR